MCSCRANGSEWTIPTSSRSRCTTASSSISRSGCCSSFAEVSLPQRIRWVSAARAGPRCRAPFIAVLEKNPIWDVPKSIQEEMAREGQIVRSKVPPGPDNPHYDYWIGLSAPGYGLHGTISPESVYHFQNLGCIRLHPDAVAALFPQLRAGMTVKIIYVLVLFVVLGVCFFFVVLPVSFFRVSL